MIESGRWRFPARQRQTFPLVAVCLVALLGSLVSETRRVSAQPSQGTMLLTVFLRHDQSKTLDEIQTHQKSAGFYKNFPPQGIEVVSWYVMMGIGQVVTLRVPPDRLREVNLAVERNAWGSFRTEFYPTYDFRPVWQEQLKLVQ